MGQRVVITGLGVVSPNAIGKDDFKDALLEGRSGVTFHPQLQQLNFRCQVGAIPKLSQRTIKARVKAFRLGPIQSTGVLYGCMAAAEAWQDAGFSLALPEGDGGQNKDAGCIFGTGSNGAEVVREAINQVGKGAMKRLDKHLAFQSMNNCVSLYIGRLLGLGNWVATNASACNTGTEALLEGFLRIRSGKARTMLVGSSESDSPYVWGPFDALFALAKESNHAPEAASRPLSVDANGFVPGSGSGALVLESLESARERGARIYAELLGGHINAGGQRGQGSMTIGNSAGIVACIRGALDFCKVTATDIDLISGHLTSTIGDVIEIQSWQEALGLDKSRFPYVNAPKSMIGHGLSASGAIEAVAAVLQLHHGFIHPSLNIKRLHPGISKFIGKSRVPAKAIHKKLNVVAKISLGFGDVNACAVFKKWEKEEL